MGKVAVIAGHQSGKTLAMAKLIAEAEARGEHVVIVGNDADHMRKFREKYDCEVIVNNPPSRLSIDPNSPDFHPCFVRVGVRVDGIERNDLQWYDVKRLEYMTTAKTSHLAVSIEPYWRYDASRQQRRAEERYGEFPK